ncbi:hypothetical protein [uncultured Tateyamaria sp.]|uniref:hypothetical protein n=1 Tax=Tateyamaria sp. 1078 TaxID=3417464 RepID=UPI0026038E69|nr:hypothetical protein [uncultured Tateyamaria sp.]
MTEYGKSAWKKRAGKRRSIRDEARAAFTTESGTAPLGSFEDLNLAPNDMRRRVVSLMKVTRDGPVGAEQLDILTLMARTLLSTGLGSGGPMATVSRTVLSPHATTTRDLCEWFTESYDLRSRN